MLLCVKNTQITKRMVHLSHASIFIEEEITNKFMIECD